MSRAATITLIVSDVALNTHAASSAERPTNKTPATTQDGRLRSGLITGVMLAVARAMGETAPLLLTTLGNDLFMEHDPGQRMSTLSLQIFGSATAGFPDALARAWAGALTLVGIVLILYVAARLIGRRSVMAR